MKKTDYLSPSMEVLELAPESGLLNQVSGGTGSGSNMDNPDYGQNPFGA